MTKNIHLAFGFLFWLAFFPPASAQTEPIDSLRKILYNQEASPAQRREAREAIFKIQTEKAEQARSVRPQQIFLKNARRSMEALQATEDSLINQLLYVAVADTMADNYEKMEALSVLSTWMDHARPKQDLIVEQTVQLLGDTSADLYDFQKAEAVQCLVRSKNPNAYPFLMDNSWYLRTVDDYNNMNFWFLRQETAGNWALFPEIMRLMGKEEFTEVESIMMVAMLLDKIVQDPPFLIAVLNLYAQKNQNIIFTQNKQAVVELLQDMH